MPTPTTAQQLLEYRAELLAGGIAPDVADALVRDAAAEIIRATGLETRPLPSAVTASAAPASEADRGVGVSKSPA
ncbi:hypothetical protein [Streptomyces sp. NBC_00557]|uniref:hypothetical protein n=1 Tax=Streptomyces sp. NBC_00557 TaxID=2975776 RepID=UPI002E80640C|nr:hypothetical protein [Streptomyces sp. NBC_00557]WUC36390.1 hypothetical protein OG956_20275 [Streptomyces sp. NBC_00557]